MENPNLIPPLLPDELIFEILSKLPVKSLLQLKSVCKSWKTLISNSQFIKSHLHNLTVNPSITHKRLLSKTFIAELRRFVSFPVKSLLENSLDAATEHVEFITKENYFILGACNGLLCLYDLEHFYVKLWNPAIGLKSKKSTPITLTDSYHYRGFGFGYDHVNDKYKVVVSIGTSYNEYLTQVYTFGENSWTTIHNFNCATSFYKGKFVSGTLNWVIVKRGVSSNHNVILSFDLEKETHKELLLPENDGVKVSNHVLGVLDNCLCVSFDSNETHWDFWLMKKYGVAESWTRLMMIPREKLRHSLQNSPCFNIEPLFFFENRIILMKIYSKLVLYNLNNGRLDALPGGNWSQQHIYSESLVSPIL